MRLQTRLERPTLLLDAGADDVHEAVMEVGGDGESNAAIDEQNAESADRPPLDEARGASPPPPLGDIFGALSPLPPLSPLGFDEPPTVADAQRRPSSSSLASSAVESAHSADTSATATAPLQRRVFVQTRESFFK